MSIAAWAEHHDVARIRAAALLFTGLGGLARQLDLPLLRAQPHAVAVLQAQPAHVVGAYQQRAGLFDVPGGELALVQGRTLAGGAAGGAAGRSGRELVAGRGPRGRRRG